MESDDDAERQFEKDCFSFFVYLCYLSGLGKMENKYNKENVRE